MIPKPLLKPHPIAGISGLVLAASFASTSTSSRHFATMSTSRTWATKQYVSKHQTWPYNPSDFTRQDSSPDTSFYSQARLVTHIDDAAIASLREYYDATLPRKGRILDFCSSWVSHYPPSIEAASENGDLKITGIGMNKAELDTNDVLNNGRILRDLNENPDVSGVLLAEKRIEEDERGKLDASTCVVSVDYLTKPVEVLKSLREATKTGGTVHLTISNRCFPTKAISRWLRIHEPERLEMVGDFLHFAGWKKIEILDLKQTNSTPPGGLQGLMSLVGMNHTDPLWIVRAVKE